jgi:hypothetical protein
MPILNRWRSFPLFGLEALISGFHSKYFSVQDLEPGTLDNVVLPNNPSTPGLSSVKSEEQFVR